MKMRNVEDIYPLSPMQQLMLMQSLTETQAGLLFEQLLCTLQGAIQPELLQQAWHLLIERHAMLRTAFLWEGLEQPLQVVRRQVNLPWTVHDWRDQSPDAQQAELERLLEADRAQDFHLGQAPLLRITLIRIADDLSWFVWSRHHILLDGWSGSLLLKELFELYDTLYADQPMHPPVARPFRNYIAWLQQQDQAEAEQFWRQRLQGFRRPTPISIEAVPEQRATLPAGYAEEAYALPEATTTALHQLSRRQQITLTTLIEGAWGLLLSLYSGQRDIIFGGTVSGRPANLAGVETMIGQFINNLPIRVQISPETVLLAWLRELQASELQARQYEHIPLPQIQQWSEVPPGLRLFESIVIVNYVDEAALKGISRNLELRDMRPMTWTNFPLTLLVVLGNPITLRIKYDRRRFPVAGISMIARHFTRLLEQITHNPQQRLGDMSLLTEQERQTLLIDWNSRRLEYDREHRLHHLVAAHAARTPDAPAVLAGEQQLTYDDLNRRADQVAQSIQARGVVPGTTVALYMDHTPELLIGLLALLKAGCAVLPLDPHTPPERIAALLTLAQAGLLLTRSELAAHLHDLTAQIICLDSEAELHPDRYSAAALPATNATHPAYQVPISLPTGQPGLVTLDHGALAHLVAARQATFALPPTSRVLLVSPPGLASALFELCLAWSAGAALCLDPQASWLLDAELQRIAQQYALTHLTLPVSALPGLSAATVAARQLILLHDTPITVKDEAILSAAASCVVVYGTLETATLTSAFTWQPGTAPRTIGYPVGNTSVYVLDPALQPVPIGIPGDLYIGGDSLAHGYVNHPDLTDARFVPHPYNADPNARLYRTGDRARYLPDGRLELLGRNDRQMNIRGVRIEPAEIEQALEQHPAIERAVVVAGEQETGSRQLLAYFVAHNGNPPAADELHTHLRRTLHAAMLPTTFLPLERLPLLPDGSIDYQALPAARGSRPDLATDYVAPASEIEHLLADIWQELLGIRQIGIHDNFFALGGNSLHATQMISRMRELFPLELPLHTLFEHATISRLAAQLETLLLEKLEAMSEEEARNLV
ncbi:MAG: condensation domain-containing protein [Chloroflexaceae bacterium]